MPQITTKVTAGHLNLTFPAKLSPFVMNELRQLDATSAANLLQQGGLLFSSLGAGKVFQLDPRVKKLLLKLFLKQNAQFVLSLTNNCT